jgi:histidinol-phosphate aminotransferase
MSSPSSTSRRSFLRYAGMTAAAMPIMTEGRLAWAAQQQQQKDQPQVRGKRQQPALDPNGPPPVMINANENPLGPCQSALAAIDASALTGGRYDANGGLDKLVALLSKQSGIPEDHIAVYAGSSEPLHFTVLAFASDSKPYVTADPSYEAGMWAAQAAGAKVSKWPLTETYAHDVKAMVAASPNAGVIYICNPNNPTGTLTPKEDIVWAAKNKPASAVLLVDEAYIHLSNAPSCLDLVQQGADVIVLRTFSKVYGMAGIRCGVAFGRPDLLMKLQRYGMNPLPVTAVNAATASLSEADLVATRRKIIADTRNDTFKWLGSKGYKFIPSVSNCFMIDTGRPGKEVIAAMQQKGVFIGRTWPIWPNHVRVSVGTPSEMAAFQTAFEAVMSAPATPVSA